MALAASMTEPPPSPTTTSQPLSRYRMAPAATSWSLGLGVSPSHTDGCSPAAVRWPASSCHQPASTGPAPRSDGRGGDPLEDLRRTLLLTGVGADDDERPGDRRHDPLQLVELGLRGGDVGASSPGGLGPTPGRGGATLGDDLAQHPAV